MVLGPKMMHSDINSTTKGITRIAFLSILGLCLIWTHYAYASSTHTSDVAGEFVSSNHKLLAISTGIKNNIEEGKEKIFNHEQEDEDISRDMISRNGWATHLPFDFELPIPFP
jgi:hypothetical protein